MTPKDKAKELVNRFISEGCLFANAKKCALICVDEILNLEPPELSYLEPFSKSWWQEVKNELNKQE